MKNKLNTAVALVLSLAFLPVFADSVLPAEFKKEYHESFTVNSDVLVDLSNKYGDIEITTGSEDKVTIDVVVSLDASNQEKAQKLLDRIEISISGSNDKVSAMTQITEKGNFDDLSIDYTVYMPKSAQLELVNKFGDVSVTTVDGPTNIYVGYGALNTGALNSKSNEVTVKYGKGHVAFASYMDMTLRYTDRMNVGKAKLLNLDSQFSEVEIGAVGRLNLDAAYDDIELTAGAEVIGILKYADMEIGAVTSKLDVRVAYGDLEVSKIDSEFKLVDLNVQFADASIVFEDESQFTLEAEAAYGDISLPSSKLNLSKDESYTSVDYEGSTKSGAGNATVKLKASYGDIRVGFD